MDLFKWWQPEAGHIRLCLGITSFNGNTDDYVGDITYIATQEGWLYLAVVIDLFSRKVVGWSMDKRMKAKLVNDALLMALWKRKPATGISVPLLTVSVTLTSPQEN